MSNWAKESLPTYSVLSPDTSLAVNETLAETSEVSPSSASASDPVCAPAVPNPAPSVNVTDTDPPPTSVVPDEGDAAIHASDAALDHVTDVDARFVTVTVTVAVVPRAHDSDTDAGDTSSGGVTVNVTGRRSSSPPATPKARSAEWAPFVRPAAEARTVTAAFAPAARFDPKLAVSKLSHDTDEMTSQSTAAAPLLLKATTAVTASGRLAESSRGAETETLSLSGDDAAAAETARGVTQVATAMARRNERWGKPEEAGGNGFFLFLVTDEVDVGRSASSRTPRGSSGATGKDICAWMKESIGAGREGVSRSASRSIMGGGEKRCPV
jgi:hypothetical protein